MEAEDFMDKYRDMTQSCKKLYDQIEICKGAAFRAFYERQENGKMTVHNFVDNQSHQFNMSTMKMDKYPNLEPSEESMLPKHSFYPIDIFPQAGGGGFYITKAGKRNVLDVIAPDEKRVHVLGIPMKADGGIAKTQTVDNYFITFPGVSGHLLLFMEVLLKMNVLVKKDYCPKPMTIWHDGKFHASFVEDKEEEMYYVMLAPIRSDITDEQQVAQNINWSAAKTLKANLQDINSKTQISFTLAKRLKKQQDDLYAALKVSVDDAVNSQGNVETRFMEDSGMKNGKGVSKFFICRQAPGSRRFVKQGILESDLSLKLDNVKRDLFGDVKKIPTEVLDLGLKGSKFWEIIRQFTGEVPEGDLLKEDKKERALKGTSAMLPKYWKLDIDNAQEMHIPYKERLPLDLSLLHDDWDNEKASPAQEAKTHKMHVLMGKAGFPFVPQGGYERDKTREWVSESFEDWNSDVMACRIRTSNNLLDTMVVTRSTVIESALLLNAAYRIDEENDRVGKNRMVISKDAKNKAPKVGEISSWDVLQLILSETRKPLMEFEPEKVVDFKIFKNWTIVVGVLCMVDKDGREGMFSITLECPCCTDSEEKEFRGKRRNVWKKSRGTQSSSSKGGGLPIVPVTLMVNSVTRYLHDKEKKAAAIDTKSAVPDPVQTVAMTGAVAAAAVETTSAPAVVEMSAGIQGAFQSLMGSEFEPAGDAFEREAW